MIKQTLIAVVIFHLFTNVYALQPFSVLQGAERYDWQNCVDSLRNYCINQSCLTSEDPDCKDTCIQTAADKCMLEGINPPAADF